MYRTLRERASKNASSLGDAINNELKELINEQHF